MIKTAIVLSLLLIFGFTIVYFINPANIFAELVITSENEQVLSTENTQTWEPNITNKSPIEINGKAGIVYNLTDEETVFVKGLDYKGPIASLVKVMTAMVVIDNYDISKSITISKKASEVVEDSMGVLEGEKYTIEELLYGLLLPSGNDSAFALAEQVKPNYYSEFVKLMNAKTLEIGMENTIFTNPSGLEEDDEVQLSNLKDVLKMSRYAINNYPLIRTITATKEYVIEGNEYHHEQTLYNQNFMLQYPNIKGLKTGYTPDAGLCLITYATVNGKEVIAIVLNSDNRQADMIYMLDYAMGMIE